MRSFFCLAALLGLVSNSIVEAEVAPPQPPAASKHQRELPLQGGQNFRDLGGYRTLDGRSVRWRLLYRSGSMHFLTAADYAYLEKLGIHTICDFRDDHERSVEPSEWPAGAAPDILTDDYHMDLAGIGLNKPDHRPTAQEARATMLAMYPKLLTQFNGQYRRMFRELIAGHAPLAFHCTAGKDRTGIAAALLLTALNVPRETVTQDYALTNLYFDASKVTHSQTTGPSPNLPQDVLNIYMRADPIYIEAVFRVMDAHPGGVPGYLHDELGLSHADIKTLSRMYTERK